MLSEHNKLKCNRDNFKLMLPKQPVNPNWFNQFHVFNLQESYSALLEFGIQAEKIASFGCWTGEEPFALLWTFDASEITVVELEEKYVNNLRELIEKIKSRTSECLEGRSIKSILADMTLPVSELHSDYFDLAFCSNVLYYMKTEQTDFEKVQSAIDQMARVVRPGGWVVAIEPKMDVTFEEKESSIIPGLPSLEPLNEPSDISDLFVKAGLTKSNFGTPPLYVYTKPIVS